MNMLSITNVKIKKAAVRHAVHSRHQLFGEVTNQITNFKSPIFLFQVTKMCCVIQLRLRIWNVYRNWIIPHILVIWNRKTGDLKLVIWLLTSPKNWWLWTARLPRVLKTVNRTHLCLTSGYLLLLWHLRRSFWDVLVKYDTWSSMYRFFSSRVVTHILYFCSFFLGLIYAKHY